jgi:hypothetical protein
VSAEKKKSNYVNEKEVDHPSHYNYGSIETIDVIEEQNWGVGFCAGNAVKYIMRHEHKGKPIEDLEKAKWYLERLIEFYRNNGKREKKNG